MTIFEANAIAVSENKTETLLLTQPDKTSRAPSVVLPAPGQMLVLRRPSYVNVWAAVFKKALTHHDNCNGYLPIHHAAAQNNVPAVRILLEKTENGISAKDSSGKHAIQLARLNGAAEVVNFLEQQSTNAQGSTFAPTHGTPVSPRETSMAMMSKGTTIALGMPSRVTMRHR